MSSPGRDVIGRKYRSLAHSKERHLPTIALSLVGLEYLAVYGGTPGLSIVCSMASRSSYIACEREHLH
jgi:hypothetical protein